MSFKIECKDSNYVSLGKGVTIRNNGEYIAETEVFTDSLPVGTDLKAFNLRPFSQVIKRYVIDARLEAAEKKVVVKHLQSTSQVGTGIFELYEDFYQNGLPFVQTINGVKYSCFLYPPARVKD